MPSPSLLAVLCNSCKEQLSPQLSRFSLSSSQSCSQHPQLAKKYLKLLLLQLVCINLGTDHMQLDWPGQYGNLLVAMQPKLKEGPQWAQCTANAAASVFFIDCRETHSLVVNQDNLLFAAAARKSKQLQISCHWPLQFLKINWFQAQCETLILVASCNKSCIFSTAAAAALEQLGNFCSSCKSCSWRQQLLLPSLAFITNLCHLGHKVHCWTL